ncbi:zinc-binding alcohol dehydrogenase family protein [Streptomyces caniscabiei]|uniref:zinc-binding alcohol dehydrogenase family protein n=1 Tax=Streptomyces caniscabiei TaxID=2746961 RepID=UPI000A8329BA|nr:zinc-binding alcohol dehydrogenase family protein [Streptomyces caniscabiei]
MSGRYAEQIPASATALVHPEDLPTAHALARPPQGLTPWHLLRTTAPPLAPGKSVVVDSAAGGVGTPTVRPARRFSGGRVSPRPPSVPVKQLALEPGRRGIAEYPSPTRRASSSTRGGGILFDTSGHGRHRLLVTPHPDGPEGCTEPAAPPTRPTPHP